MTRLSSIISLLPPCIFSHIPSFLSRLLATLLSLVNEGYLQELPVLFSTFVAWNLITDVNNYQKCPRTHCSPIPPPTHLTIFETSCKTTQCASPDRPHTGTCRYPRRQNISDQCYYRVSNFLSRHRYRLFRCMGCDLQFPVRRSVR